ncbi:unnamed protein product [Arctia plantaginis]|uniref:DDE Tnp4 domain-containing protein n=1 Tax=Arctia plantaginis TaxID=874455 RepID=A0A8S1AVH1_ARCPL|nr:unnamed protein product [Arctia plantaginis]
MSWMQRKSERRHSGDAMCSVADFAIGRKNLSDDKSEMYKTGGGTFCPKTTIVDEKIVALLNPQFKPLPNELDSSAPYYNLDIETQVVSEDEQVGTPQDIFVVLDACFRCDNFFKHKWRVFRKPMECKVETAIDVIKAATCLHNYIIVKRGNYDLDFSQNMAATSVTTRGLASINPTNRRSTSESFQIREKFVNYFNTNN